MPDAVVMLKVGESEVSFTTTLLVSPAMLSTNVSAPSLSMSFFKGMAMVLSVVLPMRKLPLLLYKRSAAETPVTV